MSRRFHTSRPSRPLTDLANGPMDASKRHWIHGPLEPLERPPHPGDRAVSLVAIVAILLALATIIIPGCTWLIGGAQ